MEEPLFAAFLTGVETHNVTVGMAQFVTIKKVNWGSLMAAGDERDASNYSYGPSTFNAKGLLLGCKKP